MPVVIVEQEWFIYRFWDIHGRLLYIGQTGRAAVARWLEHIKHQWWAGEIVTMQRQALTYRSEAAVLRAEEIAIKSEFPLHNDKHNHGNPNRIVAPPHGVTVQRARRPMARPEPVRARRRLTRWQRRALTVVGGWLATVFLTWIPLHADHPGWSGLKLAAVLVTVVALGLWMATGRKRRRRRRRVW